MARGLKAPLNLKIDFAPSPKQYELWNSLQPTCPDCGGEIIQELVGYDRDGHAQYKPVCSKCGNTNIPQMILGGGAAGGGKSYLGSCWLISSCMRFENIRAVVARKTFKALKESTWNTIKTVLKDWGLKEGENYKINNLEGTITFWNDSVIIMKEMVDLPSDPNFERFGSSEYTIAFIDEVSEISERAVEVLFSRLRWKTHETFKVPKLFMSTNPCVTWVRSRFVQDDDGNPAVCANGEKYIPFCLFDNPNIQFVQTYEAALNKIKDKATRERLLYGNWDFVDTNELAAYWNFDGKMHLVDNLMEKHYDTMKPIISLWDFNVSPYMSEIDMQIDYDKKEVYIFRETLGKPKEKTNNTPALSRKLRDIYTNDRHLGGVVVSGDPAGKARSTQTEAGVNNFTIVLDNLKTRNINPTLSLFTKQPPQIRRLEFVNELFSGFEGWKVMIDMRCRKLTEDLIYQKKNSDGTKEKKKVNDPNNPGSKYEKYGHLSDCLDYGLCFFLNNEWQHFQSKKEGVFTARNSSIMYNQYSY